MTNTIQQMSRTARQAVQMKNWTGVKVCAREILSRKRDSAEGYFLLGLAEKAANRHEQAERAFTRAIDLDDSRYDAAVELAGEYMRTNQCGAAVGLLQRFESQMNNSPLYLEMAGTILTDAGLAGKAWPLYRRANELQPGINSLQASFAACSVYIGKIAEAQRIYGELLETTPDHQRNHYELSRLSTAKDTVHIEQIKGILEPAKLGHEKSIYAYYALGKEFEDLGRWEEAFKYFKLAGDAAANAAKYDVETDVRLIEQVIDVCDDDWMADRSSEKPTGDEHKRPIFVVGLPRSGTTLTERILSSHSMIESVGESFFIQTTLKEVSRVTTHEAMSPAIIAAAATKDIKRIAKGYLQAIEYKFGDKPVFIEKFPENFLYLGFIAKAFPNAKIIHVKRNPMDACFAMYKQSFFRYAYTLDDLGRYYVAYRRLLAHWRRVLKDRLIEVDYEALVTDQDAQTRRLLDNVGVDFEEECLSFENNKSASNTASTVQIREKIHARSVDRWKCFATQLQALKKHLLDAGMTVA